MKLEVEIEDSFLRDLLLSAVDHINYWDVLHEDTQKGGARTYYVIEHNEDLHAGQPVRHNLNFKRGVQLCLDKYPRVLDPNNLDAMTGDMFVQLCAFGELRYG